MESRVQTYLNNTIEDSEEARIQSKRYEYALEHMEDELEYDEEHE